MKKNYPRNEEKENPKGPHLLRSWEPDGEGEGKWLCSVGGGVLVVFTVPAEGGGMLEDGFRM